ncbi:MAG: class I SAM-dependent methyltransferase [bacterium]
MTEPDSTKHWEQIYASKDENEVSWFQEKPEQSLQLISSLTDSKLAQIIDVGGGASVLVDHLLKSGYYNLSVLDLSANALEKSKQRLGNQAETIDWIVGDITTLDLAENHYDIWHDRAVFHFLTSEEQRNLYVKQVMKSVKPNGYVLIATFGLDGPEKCSGLPIVRYDPDSLHDEFGAQFTLIDHLEELHETPFGTTQQFVYCYCRKEV